MGHQFYIAQVDFERDYGLVLYTILRHECMLNGLLVMHDFTYVQVMWSSLIMTVDYDGVLYLLVKGGSMGYLV